MDLDMTEYMKAALSTDISCNVKPIIQHADDYSEWLKLNWYNVCAYHNSLTVSECNEYEKEVNDISGYDVF